jgi:hypothetical protein
MLKNNNLRLLLVFLIALVLRGIRPGLYIVHLDELVTFNAVADLVKQGEWTWIGNPSTWKLLPYHSPLPNYILSPDGIGSKCESAYRVCRYGTNL